MKNFLKILFGILCLLTIGVAQAQFNYVGLIKDANGNPVSSQNLSMRISILDESQNIDYQESHTVSSSADGIVDLVIGNGTVISGLFSELDWSRTFYLKDEVDFGNGYVTMGIEAIKPVPLASYALNTVSATIRSDAYGNITLGDSNLLNRSVNESSIAIGNQALSNVRNTHPSWSPSDMPSSSIDETLFGVAGNIAIGAGAFASPQASTSTVTENAIGNVTIGHMSMYNAAKSTSANIALGTFTLPVIEEGGGNITMGWNGLFSLVKGSSNIAIGQNNMENSLEGNWNVSLGKSAMSNATYADGNTAIGNYALRNIGSTLDRLYSWTEDGIAYSQMNTAVGHAPLYSLTEGNFNTVVGALSLYNLTSGYRNVTLGYHTFNNLNGGDYNTAIGDGAGYETTGVVSRTTLIGASTRIASGVVNSTAIGHAANVTASNTIQLGDTNIQLVNTSGIVSATAFVGDGSGLTNLPSAGLDQDGNVSITNSAPQFESTGVTPTTFNHSGNNVAIGDNALLNATSTAANIAIGANTLMNATTGNVSGSASSTGLNLAIGDSAMVELQSGWVNQAIGTTAMRNLNSGYGNVAIGSGAMEDVNFGEINVAIGLDALHQGGDNTNSIAIGNRALWNVTSVPNPPDLTYQELVAGTDNPSTTLNEAIFGLPGNIAIGSGAYASPQSSTTTYTESSDSNIAIGHMAMYNAPKDTSNNNVVGAYNLASLNEGYGNTAFGSYNMKNMESGRYNVSMGTHAMEGATEMRATVAIGVASMYEGGIGVQNTAIGYQSLRSIGKTVSQTGWIEVDEGWYFEPSATSNVGVGAYSLSNTDHGFQNVAIGRSSLLRNIDGYDNVAVGDRALRNNLRNFNTGVGRHALEQNVDGDYNTAIGYFAGAQLKTNNDRHPHGNTFLGAQTDVPSGTYIENSTAIGHGAIVTTSNTVQLGADSVQLVNTNGVVSATAFVGDGSQLTNIGITSEENTAVGYRTQENSSSGSQNTSLGYESLKNNTSGNGNVAIGHHALLEMDGTGSTSFSNNYSHSASTENTAIGKAAMGDNTEGSFNTAVGAYALQNNGTGFNNTALGLWTLNRNNNGVGNTAIGWGALINTENGGGNVAVGTHTGQYLANNSNNNTFLGDNSGTTETNSSTSIFNATAVGSQAKVTESNAMSFGDSNVTKWAFGLNTTDSGKVIQVGFNSGNGNGAYLTAGGVWTDASSILFKTNFIDLDNDWIKRQIAKLNIRRWDYKDTEETHIGPTAEEFIDLFSVGIETDKQHLSTLDVAGVALKGVQAVIQENQELKEENAALEQQYQDLKELLTQVLQRVEKLEQQ